MKPYFLVPLFVLLLTACSKQPIREFKVSSPDGIISIEVKETEGKIYYQVFTMGDTIMEPSLLGLQFINVAALDNTLKITSQNISSCDTTWEQPWGECRYVRDNYNRLKVSIEQQDKFHRKFDLVFKVYNDGIGFRYEFPAQLNLDSMLISEELTEFNFTYINKAWWIPVHSENSYYESLYRHTSICDIDTANTPITLTTPKGIYIALHEANLRDYSSMTLVKTGASSFKCNLVSMSNGIKVYCKTPMHTPWRTILIADKPGDLITSYMMLNLNEPNALGDIGWIKPSKCIGIWWAMHLGKYSWHSGDNHGATTENTKKYIDFAAENGFGGVLVEGWNLGWDHGHEIGNKFSYTQSYPDFNLEEVCAYGASKNVKLIGHHETYGNVANYEKQMEDAFRLYNKNGVATVKTGYVHKFLDNKEWHDGQYGINHYMKVIELAAKYHIMLDVHEPIKPTGLQRTFPNLMAQEGARGQEFNAWSRDGGNPPSHTTILPFTRLLAGPMDYTPGVFNFDNPVNPAARVQSTLANQLALFVVIYCPMPMACDLPENYTGVKAFDFIKDVPSDWEVTKVLNGDIGNYITIVRKDRKSEDWFLGSITNEQTRELSLPLNFLDSTTTYIAQIYADGEKAEWKTNPTDYTYQVKDIQSTDTLTIKLASGGGQAIRFIKK